MISLGELRTWCNVEGGTAHDALLVALEARMVSVVELETGRYFGAVAAVTWVLSGADRPILWLPDRLATLTSVETRGTLADAWELLASTDYELDDRQLARLSTVGWPRGTRNVRVIGTRGYAAGSEPADVRQLVLDLVMLAYKEGRSAAVAKLPTDLFDRIPGARRTIERYRSLPV